MIQLGKMQTLTAVRRTQNGLYLKDNYDDTSDITVLLPNNDIKDDCEVGDDFNVFIYKDSKDRLIATTKIPYITLGKFATLTVKDASPIGAFLDWGLAKDLLLPFREQKTMLSEGDKVFVSLYIDKSQRLCATTKVYELLSLNSPYKKGDIVTGTVYEIKNELGAFIAVDDKYSALLPTSYIIRPLSIGDTISAYVKKVREDGKLTLSLTPKAVEHIDSDAKKIYNELKVASGYLAFNDKSSSDDIKQEFGMSKNSFKRAIGRLYKEKKIEIKEDGIHLI